MAIHNEHDNYNSTNKRPTLYAHNNPYQTREAKEAVFSPQRVKDLHQLLKFSYYQINVEKIHMHFGLNCDEILTFAEHVREAIKQSFI